jgi:hypothetical protein
VRAFATKEYMYDRHGVRDGFWLGDAIVCAAGAEECRPTNCLCGAALCAIGERPNRRRQKEKEIGANAPPGSLAAAMAAPPATSDNAAARQAQNPLTPLYSIINENDTSPGVGPLRRTQNVLLIEPVIPIRLTPDFNLVTRWITPVVRQPALAPTIGSEFGLGNIQPQFFFTPALKGDGFVWSLGPNFWLPTATDKTLGTSGVAGRLQWHCGSRVP